MKTNTRMLLTVGCLSHNLGVSLLLPVKDRGKLCWLLKYLPWVTGSSYIRWIWSFCWPWQTKFLQITPLEVPIWFAEITVVLDIFLLVFVLDLPRQYLPLVDFYFFKSTTDLQVVLRESKKVKGWHHLLTTLIWWGKRKEQPRTWPTLSFCSFPNLFLWLHYLNVIRKHMGSETLSSTCSIHECLMNSSRSVSHNDLANLTPIYFCINLIIDYPVIDILPSTETCVRARC